MKTLDVELLFEDALCENYTLSTMEVGGSYKDGLFFSTVRVGDIFKYSDFHSIFETEHISICRRMTANM